MGKNQAITAAGKKREARSLPETYGPWQSVYARFAKWRDDGTLEAVFRVLSADADMDKLDASFLAFVYLASIAILLI